MSTLYCYTRSLWKGKSLPIFLYEIGFCRERPLPTILKMLQPSASPGPGLQHPDPYSTGGQQVAPPHPTRRTSAARPSLWQWVTSKELIFVFVACCLGVFLFRTRDTFQLMPVWREKLDKSYYANLEFPLDSEKL